MVNVVFTPGLLFFSLFERTVKTLDCLACRLDFCADQYNGKASMTDCWRAAASAGYGYVEQAYEDGDGK